MKKGKEYENFVFKIFSEFFKGFDVKADDYIMGNQSGIKRQIDVSIRGKLGNSEVFYIVQAKHKGQRKADMLILGEFSSVIRDVGASKGFLVCSSGFAKSNHRYARSQGIELMSVEDVRSKNWKADIKIPVVFVTYDINYQISVAMKMDIINEVMKQYGGFSIENEDKFNVSVNEGKTFIHINEYITDLVRDGKLDFNKKETINFKSLRLKKYPTVEFPSSSLTIDPQKKFYLKQLIPNEYRGIKDHLNDTFTPTTFEISDIPLAIDSTFIPISENDIPKDNAGFSIRIDLKPQV